MVRVEQIKKIIAQRLYPADLGVNIEVTVDPF